MSAIILGVGTAGCAVIRHLVRLKRDKRKRLKRALRVADSAGQALIEKALATLEREPALLAFDVDSTNSYPLPAPPEDDGDWPAGIFHPIPLPGRDDRERIKAGATNFTLLNPAAIEGLDGDANASGGTRPNGHAAVQHNIGRIRGIVEGAILSQVGQRQIVAKTRQGPICTYLVASGFGGCGSGGLQPIEEILTAAENKLGLRLEIHPVLLVPGVHASKDPVNSLATTGALIKEITAASTGRLFRFGSGVGAVKAAAEFHPFIYLSDINSAWDSPKILPPANFLASVACLLDVLTSTPIGDYIDSQNGDFTLAGAKAGVAGEPCHGRSIGHSVVFFDRQRQFDYSSTIHGDRFVEEGLRAPGEEQVRTEVLRFFAANGFLYGDNRTDLVDHLVQRAAVEHVVGPKRFLTLFRKACASIEGVHLLREARHRSEVALQWAGDFDQAINRESEEHAAGFASAVAKGARDIFCDAERGPGHSSAWLAQCGALVESEAAACEAARAAKQAEARQAEASVVRVENEIAPGMVRMGAIRRYCMGPEIAAAASELVANLEKAAVCGMEAKALEAAGRALRSALESVRSAYGRVVETAAALTGARELLLERRGQAAGQCADFHCPNGLPLLDSEADLIDLHNRMFDPAANREIQREIYAALPRLDDPFAALADADATLGFLDAALGDSLLARRTEALDVWDEFEHRFPDLAIRGAALRERENESYERLALTSGPRDTVVRVAGVRGRHSEALQTLIEKNTAQRGGPFVPVEIGDPERIVLLQVRAVFPMAGTWRGMALCRAAYRTAHAENTWEKHHVVPAARFLPEPGVRLTHPEIRCLVFKAWILGRLGRPGGGCWALSGALPGDPEISLGDRFEAFESIDGYRIAVDIASDFGCFYYEHGPETIRARMAAFRQGGSSAGDPDETIDALTRCDIGSARRAIEEELAWWARNSVAALMPWAQAARGNGVGEAA